MRADANVLRVFSRDTPIVWVCAQFEVAFFRDADQPFLCVSLFAKIVGLGLRDQLPVVLAGERVRFLQFENARFLLPLHSVQLSANRVFLLRIALV